MALPNTLAFEELLIEVDADGSGDYARKCGMVTKSVSFTAATAQSEVPDCDDESLPATQFTGVKSVALEISGSGTMVSGDFHFWMNWMTSGAPKSVRVSVVKPQVKGGGQWTSDYVLTAFKGAVNIGEKAMSADVTLMNAGAIGDFVRKDEA